MSDNRRDRDAYGPDNPIPAPAAGATPAGSGSTAGARLYDRKCQIIVADKSGQGIDVAGLRCRFSIHAWEISTPNFCELRITNLSPETGRRMMAEFTRLQISAGYAGQFGKIFDGTIVQARRGRESPTDSFCAIVATDGDQPRNYGVINQTLAAGAKPADVLNAARTAMGVPAGYSDPASLEGDALPRGKVMFGHVRETMHNLARNTDSAWSIQDGKLNITSRDGYLPNEVVIINSQTGMVGVPTIAPDGIYVRTLLNPLLKPGQRVQLNNESIQTPRPVLLPGGAVDPRQAAALPKIEGDGLYKVLACDHLGDTRGVEWYSEISCVGATQGSTPASSRGRGRAVPKDLVPLPASETGGRRDKG